MTELRCLRRAAISSLNKITICYTIILTTLVLPTPCLTYTLSCPICEPAFSLPSTIPLVVLHSLTATLQLVTEWRRRVSWFVDGVQRSLETLGVSRSPLHAKEPQITADQDYLLVLQRLQDLKAELDSVITSLTGILGTVQGEVSLDEA